jgi:hypothetical protein
VLLLLTSSPRIDVGAQASSQDGARAAQSPSDIAGLLLAQHQVVTFPALKKKVKRTIEKSQPTFLLSSGESRAFLFELPAMTGLFTLKKAENQYRGPKGRWHGSVASPLL